MRLFCFLLLIIFLHSCGKKEENITIEKQQLISILADLHIAGELINKFREEDKDSVRKVYMHDISTIYNLDTAIINKNIQIIQKNPDLAFLIYQDVYKKLDSIGKPPPKPVDDINVENDTLLKK